MAADRGADHVIPVGACPPTVQERAWTNLQEEYRSWKGLDFISFCEDWIAQGRRLTSLPMHGEKQNL